MKQTKSNRKISIGAKYIVLTAALCTMMLAGCMYDSVAAENTHMAAITDEPDIDALFEASLPRLLLPPDIVPDEPICTDFTSRGLLRICYKNNTDSALKLQVLYDENSIAYNLKGDGSLEDFPLQYGDGEYTARIMQNIEGEKYFAVDAKTFSVKLDSQNLVYLNSVQNIDWDYDRKAIKAVKIIVYDTVLGKSENIQLSSAQDLYNYIIENIKYDDKKVFSLSYEYLPDIDQTFIDGKGICYDYSSLFAAMLRSINIPAKLVKGYASYAPESYHAWNEVYIMGEWVVIDTTKDAGLLLKPDMQKDSADYKKVYEY